MRIVIIGLGTIGKTILKNLSGEGHTVTIIDEDKNKIEDLIEKYDVWPILAKSTLVVVMFIGSMAGSTADGIKVSRIVIAIKGTYINVRKLINPRYVPQAKFEGKFLEEKTISDVFAFITLYFFLFIVAIFLLSFDPVNGTTVQSVSDAGSYEVKHGFFRNFSAVLTCISNVGHAFEAVGPYAILRDIVHSLKSS